jgi:hypothetical protein
MNERAFSPGCLSTPSTSAELSAGATGELARYSTAALAAATDNFSPARLLGEGGYGEVFAAHWPDGTVLAVKRMAPDSTEGEAGFLAEVSVTGAVRHANVLPVLGVVRRAAWARGRIRACLRMLARRCIGARRAAERRLGARARRVAPRCFVARTVGRQRERVAAWRRERAHALRQPRPKPVRARQRAHSSRQRAHSCAHAPRAAH